MKDLIKPALKLALICAVAAFALGFVNSITAPRIAENERVALQEALNMVALQYDAGKEVIVDDPKIKKLYPLYSGSEQIGVILELKAMGYGGAMTVLATYDMSGTVLAAELLTNNETPGIGKLAEKDGYMDKFIGTGGEKPVPVTKGRLSQDEADAISGATITFLGIGKILSYGSDFVKKGDM